MKKPFVTLDQLNELVKQYPTPFHLYDEKGIRENARRLHKAFGWNPGFREHFAVKATPNPQILKLLKEEGCGVDCSSLTDVWLPDTVSFIASDAFDGCSDSLVFHCVEGSRAFYFAKAYGFETKTDYVAP